MVVDHSLRRFDGRGDIELEGRKTPRGWGGGSRGEKSSGDSTQ